jgi:hypothetical protein
LTQNPQFMGSAMWARKKAKQSDPAIVGAGKDDCQARLEQLECELRLEQLRREDREDVEVKKAQRRRERRQGRHARWSDFWKERRKRREEAGGVSGTFRVFLFLGLPAVAALVIYAYALSEDGSEVLAIGLLTAASAFAVGALLGFLFGIPRSVAATAAASSVAVSGSDDKVAAATETDGSGTGVAAAQHFTTNTNLEQISDWLTKILVGVGLVQIHQVSGAVEDLSRGLAPGLGPQGSSVAVALLVAFSVVGFISGYLYTRLRLQRDFENATNLREVIEERADTETTAIALVQQQLTPGVEKPGLGELIKALHEATSGVREQAFFLARRQRLEKWSGEGTQLEREEMPGLSAPVFDALIACDPEGNYYRPRAELGFVLLQGKSPDFRAAKAAFDKAIELRPKELIDRTPEYELNRAYCKIEIDGRSAKGEPSPKPLAESVAADLEAVIAYLREVKKEKREGIEKWIEINKGGASEELAQRLDALLLGFKGVPASN